MFGVPASLAQQICGFRYLDHSGLRFTELIPVELVSLPQVVHALRTRLVPMLAARGSVQQSSSDDCQPFVAKTDQDDVRVYV